ncbi:hypothetical protein [Polyangium aurulentum]|uniref:hypothetical protein n=1 Tax=Polyangium aurulentum TaxID=2567896 RepID=UPI00197F138B|nr:hypothetical protein [Polyangium aurulentum]UQA55966.1 hypothetical protein E8A73_032205 [Polyangium aurulentum]
MTIGIVSALLLTACGSGEDPTGSNCQGPCTGEGGGGGSGGTGGGGAGSGGGGAGNGGGGGGPSGPGQRVFVSSKVYPADFMKNETDSLEVVGERMCTELATAAGVGGGPWRAWLSSTTVNARDVVTGPGPFYDMAGKVVFADRFDLLGGARGTNVAETGEPLPNKVDGMTQFNYVFTGTKNNGAYDADHGNCADWTDADKAIPGIVFLVQAGSEPFSECIGPACSGHICGADLAHIYCFEVR